MKRSQARHVLAALAFLGLVAGSTPAGADPLHLSATFKVEGVRESGDSVHLNFSFSLRAGQPSDLAVEAIKLGSPSAADHPYATFHGGTIPAGGELKESKDITVPTKAYKKWKAGEPAALFVRTAGDTGGASWTRVDASAGGPIQ